MRAEQEYYAWCVIGSKSDKEKIAYITGFNRAVELMELHLKEKQNETVTTQISSS